MGKPTDWRMLSIFAAVAIASWLFELLKFGARLALSIAIFCGALAAMSQAPIEHVAAAQELLASQSLTFPGSAVFYWISANWFETAILLILFYVMRASHKLKSIFLVSEHSAVVASALQQYLDFEPSHKKSLELAGQLDAGRFPIGAMVRGWLSGKGMRILGGVPFLPEDFLPWRGDKTASLREDLESTRRSS